MGKSKETFQQVRASEDSLGGKTSSEDRSLSRVMAELGAKALTFYTNEPNDEKFGKLMREETRRILKKLKQ